MVSNPSNKVKTEAINEVILRLLGLNPGVELDYQTYFNIIKKKLAIGRLVGKELPREEDELLREELKKVRAIKDKGLRFKVKTSKAKVSTGTAGPGVGGASPKTGAIIKAKTAKIVPQKIIPVNVKDVTEKKEERVGSFDQIKKTLNSILGVLASKFKFDKKQSDQERKEKETEKRGKREAGLEGFRKGISAISGAAKKMLAPFQSIIDRIWNFIFFTLLGRAFTQLMGWLGDPANKKKIQVLGRFLKDWWPTLLGAAILFFTPFGKFVRVTLKIVGSFAGKLVKLIPRIAKAVAGLGRFAAANPLATLITTTAVAGTIARTGERERLKPELDKQRESAAATQKDPGAPWYKKLGGFFAQQELTTGQQQQGIVAPVPGAMFNVGGEVPKLSTGYNGIDSTTGQKVSGFGPDTQMIIAQPGEVVMNKKTVDAVGANNLLALNRQYGGPGANKPKMGKLYNTGGIVGMQGGGNISGRSLTPWMQSFVVSQMEQAKARKDMRELNRLQGMYGDLIKPGTISLPGVQGGGMVGMQGGGNIQVKIGSPKMTSSRSAWDALNTVKTPLKYAIGDARKRLFDLEGFKNRNIDNNVRPWWQRLNPFRDNRTFADRLPGKPIENYRMPGFDLKGWSDLKNFRESPDPYKPNPKNPKIKYAPGDRYRRPGVDRPLMLQGGGEVTAESLEKTYIQGQRSGVNPETLKAIGDEAFLLKNFGVGGTWKNFRGSGASNMRGEPLPRKQGGGPIRGLVKENSGFNIRGATADRQLTALQPGEYVLPVDTVSRLGTSLIDKLVAMTDSNSNPAKVGMKSKNVPNITPLSRGGSGGIMTLPPIVQSASGSGNVGNSSGAGSRAPVFSAVSASGARQIAETASILGIVG